MGSRPQEPQILREAGSGADNYTLKRASSYLVLCIQVQMPELACRLAAVSSAVRGREALFIGALADGVVTRHILHTLPSHAPLEGASSCRESGWCDPVGGG